MVAVDPNVRCIHVCYMCIVFRYMLRIHIESQYDDTIATMDARESIVIRTRVVDKARRIA